jgi:uncharacterized membrane protein YkoI
MTDDLDHSEATGSSNDVDSMELDFEGEEEIKPKRLTISKVEVFTLEALGLSRDDYQVFSKEYEAESQAGPRVVRVVRELERDDGALWYEVKFRDGATREVSTNVFCGTHSWRCYATL